MQVLEDTHLQLKTSRGAHALYNLEYHLIICTKYRRKCITQPVFETIKDQFNKIAAIYGSEIEEISYEEDHVHVLLSVPPHEDLASLINILKSTSSRRIRKEHAAHLQKYYWKPVFWSRSYLMLSSGGAPIEVIRAYIQEQETEEHAAKKKGRPKKAAITT